MAQARHTRWRLITWNVLGAHQPNLELLAEVIEGYAADAVALQEVRRRQARRIAHRLGWQWHWARKHYPFSPLVWWRAEGLAVLSPSPMTHVMHTSISPGVSTWSYRHRILLAVTVTRGDDAVRLYTTHLASHDADARIAQARRVAEFVAQDGAPVAAVMGDLNTTDDTEIEILREFRPMGLRDPGGLVSNPSIAPYQRLDYVLVPDRATVIDQHTPDGGERWNELSDHLPVLLEFEV